MKKPNWPSNRPAVQPSSRPVSGRPEFDERLCPSRLTRTQINPKIPNDLYDEMMDFLGNARQIKLQDLVARGIRLALDEIAAARVEHTEAITGRPAVQPSSDRSDRSDQIDPADEDDQKLVDDHLSENQMIDGRPAVQSDVAQTLWTEILLFLSSRINERQFKTWFESLRCEGLDVNEEVLQLRAPNQLVKDWVVSNYSKAITEALNATKLNGFSVGWLIGDQTAKPEFAHSNFEPPKNRRPTAGDEKEELLEFFAVVMGKDINERDRSDFDKIADCSPDAVRCGILRSRLKAREPVQFFAYCLKPIRQIERSGLGPSLLPTLRDELSQAQPLLPEFGGSITNLKRKDQK